MASVNFKSMIDISQISFDDWVAFTFDHPVRRPQWYLETVYDQYTGDHTVILNACARLFQDPTVAQGRFSRAQLVQGFDFIPGYRGYTRFLSDRCVSVNVRRSCVFAMVSLFEKLFARDPLDYVCFMWFEILRTSGTYDWRHFSEDPPILESLLDTLSQILQLDSRECRRSALHGLSEFHHDAPRKTRRIIERFLSEHPQLDPELLAYAQACRNGGQL